MTRELTLDDTESLAVGAALYLADDDRVAVVSDMGAPQVGQERLADSRNIARQ